MLIDGKKIAKRMLDGVRSKIAGRQIGLAAVLIGDNPDLKKFVNIKKRTAESIGIRFSSYILPAGVAMDEVLDTIKYLDTDSGTHGILVELPLPADYDRDTVLASIAPHKDVDGLSPAVQTDFYANKFDILPPAVRAVEIILKECAINPIGKKAAIFGRGFLVGRPLAHWLTAKGAQVFPIDIETENPSRLSRNADIIIGCAGKPNLIVADMVKEGTMVIDYGFESHADKITGDVDFASVAPKAGWITPVPGGVGPVVVAAVMENLLFLAK